MKSTEYKSYQEGNSLKSFFILVIIFFIFMLLMPILCIGFSLFGLITGFVLDDIIPYEIREPACLGITITLTLIAYMLWFIFGRDKHVTQIVSFEPPQDTNSAELEVNCYGCSSERGVKSLIYYLASKDYLKIEKLNDDYVLRKLKPYDGNDEVEKIFFNGIFGNDVDIVNLNRLLSSGSFSVLCVSVQTILNNLKKDNFKNNASIVSKIIMLLICSLGVGLSLLFTIADYSFKLIFSPNSWIFIFTFIAIWVAVYFCCNYKQQLQSSVKVNGKYPKNHKKLYTTLFMIIWCAGFGGFPLLTLFQDETIKFNHPLEIIFGLVCLIICFICLVNMPQLSRKGRELRGLAMGFKRFLEVTEKRRFDELIGQNPNYAKEIYPYAFALGITESYITDLDVLAASESYSGDNLDTESIKQIYDLLKKTR